MIFSVIISFTDSEEVSPQLKSALSIDISLLLGEEAESLITLHFLNETSCIVWVGSEKAYLKLIKAGTIFGRIRQGTSVDRKSYIAQISTAASEKSPFLEISWSVPSVTKVIKESICQKVQYLCPVGTDFFMRNCGMLVRFRTSYLAQKGLDDISKYLTEKFPRIGISILHISYADYNIIQCLWKASSATFQDVCSHLSFTGRNVESVLQNSVVMWDEQPCIVGAHGSIDKRASPNDAYLVCPSRYDNSILMQHKSIDACGGTVEMTSGKLGSIKDPVTTQALPTTPKIDVYILWLFDCCPLSTGSVFESQDDAQQTCMNIDTFLTKEYKSLEKYSPSQRPLRFKKLLFIGRKMSSYSSCTQMQLQELLVKSSYEQRFFNSNQQTDTDLVIRPDISNMIEEYASHIQKPLVCLITSTMHPCNSVLATLLLQGFDNPILIVSSSQKSESIKLAKKIFLFDEIRNLHLKQSPTIKSSPSPLEAVRMTSQAVIDSNITDPNNAARMSINDSRKRLEKLNLWRDSGAPGLSQSSTGRSHHDERVSSVSEIPRYIEASEISRKHKKLIDLQSLSIATHFKHLSIWGQPSDEQELTRKGLGVESPNLQQGLKGFLLHSERPFCQNCSEDDIAKTTVSIISDSKIRVYRMEISGTSASAVNRRSAGLETMLTAMLKNRKTYPLPLWHPKHRDCIIGSLPLTETEKQIEATVLFHINEGTVVLAEIVSLNVQRHRNMKKFVEDLVPRQVDWILPRAYFIQLKERDLSHVKVVFCAKFEHKASQTISGGSKTDIVVQAWGFGALLDDAFEYIKARQDLSSASQGESQGYANKTISPPPSPDDSARSLDSLSMSGESHPIYSPWTQMQHFQNITSAPTETIDVPVLPSELDVASSIVKMSSVRENTKSNSATMNSAQQPYLVATKQVSPQGVSTNLAATHHQQVTKEREKEREREKDKEAYGSYTFQDREAGIFYSNFEHDFKIFIEATYNVRVSDVKPSAEAIQGSGYQHNAADRDQSNTKSPALRVEFWGSSTDVKALRVYLDKLNAINLTRSQIFYPRASVGKYKELCQEKTRLDTNLKDLRRKDRAPISDSRETQDTIIDPLHAAGFLNIRIKPPMHSRGLKKMVFPADTTVTICSPTYTQEQQKCYDEICASVNRIRSQYFEATLHLPSQTEIAKQLTARKTRQDFMNSHNIVGIRWEEGSRSTGGIGIAKLWAESAEDLAHVLAEAQAIGGSVEVPLGIGGPVSHMSDAQFEETKNDDWEEGVENLYESSSMDMMTPKSLSIETDAAGNEDDTFATSSLLPVHSLGTFSFTADESFIHQNNDDNISMLSIDSPFGMHSPGPRSISPSMSTFTFNFDSLFGGMYNPIERDQEFPSHESYFDVDDLKFEEMVRQHRSLLDEPLQTLVIDAHNLTAEYHQLEASNLNQLLRNEDRVSSPFNHFGDSGHAMLSPLTSPITRDCFSRMGPNFNEGQKMVITWPFADAPVMFAADPLRAVLANLLDDIRNLYGITIAYPYQPSSASSGDAEESQDSAGLQICMVLCGKAPAIVECKTTIQDFLDQCSREVFGVTLLFSDEQFHRLGGSTEAIQSLVRSSGTSYSVKISDTSDMLCLYDFRMMSDSCDPVDSSSSIDKRCLHELIVVKVSSLAPTETDDFNIEVEIAIVASEDDNIFKSDASCIVQIATIDSIGFLDEETKTITVCIEKPGSESERESETDNYRKAVTSGLNQASEKFRLANTAGTHESFADVLLLVPSSIQTSSDQISGSAINKMTIESIMHYIAQTTDTSIRRIVLLTSSKVRSSKQRVETKDDYLTSIDQLSSSMSHEQASIERAFNTLMPAFGNSLILALLNGMEACSADTSAHAMPGQNQSIRKLSCEIVCCNVPLPNHTTLEGLSELTKVGGRVAAILRGLPTNLAAALDLLREKILEIGSPITHTLKSHSGPSDYTSNSAEDISATIYK